MTEKLQDLTIENEQLRMILGAMPDRLSEIADKQPEDEDPYNQGWHDAIAEVRRLI